MSFHSVRLRLPARNSWVEMGSPGNASCVNVEGAPDLEGLAWVPEKGTDVLYLAQEADPPLIMEYDWRNNNIVRQWDLTDYVKVTSKHGIEAFEFVP